MLRSILLDTRQPENSISQLLESWKQDDLRVFVLKASSTDGVESVRKLYDDLLTAMGTPARIAEDVNVGDRHNQRTGEIWMDVRFDSSIKDAYRHSANAQPLHTDGSYVAEYPNATLMVCEANAAIGGETTFLNAEDLMGVLRAEAPQLLKQLLETTVPHARSGDRRELPVMRVEDGRIWLNWNYYCVDQNCSEEVKRLRESFHEFLLKSPGVREKTVGVKLERGDGVVWKDERVLHGRNGFQANQQGERFLWKCAIDVGSWQ